MEIVIDIDEEDYNRIKDIPDVFDSLTSRAYKSIKNGKPLTEGYWIALGNYDDWGNESSYKCSECGELDTYPDNYCHNCGCHMVEPQESEVKE